MRIYQGPNRDLVVGGAVLLVTSSAFAMQYFAGTLAAVLLCALFGSAYMFLGYFSKTEATA